MSSVRPDRPASDFSPSQSSTFGEESVFGVVSSGVPLAGEEPRLAAIVFTDVVGYSSRMHADEQGTIAAVHADFHIMRELCRKHGGEVLNTMGDGMMLAFPGAVAAMKFALDMQGGFAERNASIPHGKGLSHRVGVHIGDVYRVQGGHMAGDGVNIAARLEPRAAQGGIAISQIVYDTVKGKVEMRAERMGPQTFKNIAEQIVVWRIFPPNSEKFAPPPMPVSLPEPASASWPKQLVKWAILLAVLWGLWTYRDMIIPPGSEGGVAAFFNALAQKVLQLVIAIWTVITS